MNTILDLAERAVSPTPFGKVEGTGDIRRVEIRREIKAPLSKVWQAITTPEQIAMWFTPCEFELVEGADIKLMFDEEPKYRQKKHTSYGKIKLVMPESVFGYTWVDDTGASWHQFDLMEGDSGTTIITIMATGMVPDDGFSVGVGWHQMSERLAHYMEAGEGVRLEFDRIKEIYLHYKGRYGPEDQNARGNQ